jgi:hypothetical protein
VVICHSSYQKPILQALLEDSLEISQQIENTMTREMETSLKEDTLIWLISIILSKGLLKVSMKRDRD